VGVNVEVDFELMQSMIDALTAALADLQAAGTDLDAESQLLLAGWDGEAADAYAARHDQWQADHTYSAEELAGAIRTLQRSLLRYGSAEARIIELTS
jgi:WXG100 family type VII secretion target